MRKRQTKLANIVHTNYTITHQKVTIFILKSYPKLDFIFTFIVYLFWSFFFSFWIVVIVFANVHLSIIFETIRQDRLSELSDEILVSILSTLPFMEMQRTSVLSKRWRYLWTFTTCHLDFDDSRLLTLVWKTFYQQKFSGSDLDQYVMMLVNLENTEFEENSLRTRFVSWVNRVLELHQGNTIDEFRVVFDMDGRKFKSEIDNWICFSLRKKVKKLSLDFMMDGVNAYTLTSQIFHSYSLDSLTALSLTYVKVTGEVLEYVLSNCPFIEILHVENSESLVNLKTSSPLPKLKNLEILNCRSLKQIQIPAINLVSFKYCGVKMIRIILGDVPYFVDLSVTGDCVRYLLEDDCPISRYLSQLETLELGLFTKVSHKFHCYLQRAFSFFIYQCLFMNVLLFLGSIVQEFIQFPKFPELRNLRQLKLDLCPPFMDSFRCCTSLLKAFPVLHRFVLKVRLIIWQLWDLLCRHLLSIFSLKVCFPIHQLQFLVCIYIM